MDQYKSKLINQVFYSKYLNQNTAVFHSDRKRFYKQKPRKRGLNNFQVKTSPKENSNVLVSSHLLKFAHD